MGVRYQVADGRRPWQRVAALAMIPVGLIVLITVVDIQSPTNIHLGPLLVIAPALTPSLGGPRLTAFIGGLAVAAQVLIAVLHGGLGTSNHIAQIIALTVLSTLIVVFTVVRDRRSRQLARAQSVAEAAQRALLRPLPDQIGPLRIASMYLSAEDEAQIGGDLYSATRTGDVTRVIIGDVRGKGLAAVGESALVLNAFRLISPQHASLAELAYALDRSVGSYVLDFAQTDRDNTEHFITALLLEFTDDAPVAHMTNCGHPPLVLLGAGGEPPEFIESEDPAPPLGLHSLGAGEYPDDIFRFEVGDTLLLYTDGVIEARDRTGAFYPLAERVGQWARHTPEALVDHLRRDLLAYAGGHLGDDAAVIAIRCEPVPRHDHLLHAPLGVGIRGR